MGMGGGGGGRSEITDLLIRSCLTCFLYKEVIAFPPLHHGGECKDYSYLSEIIASKYADG